MSETQKVRMEEMSWAEIQEALKAGFDTVIIPSGSIEQHGPHLPLATDSIIAEDLATRVAKKLGKTLVAPCIRPGVSQHHMAFPGTITLPPELFAKIIEEYCTSLAHHGFRNFVLTSGHGGNFSIIDAMAPEISGRLKARGHKTKIIPYVDLKRYVQVQQAFVKEKFGITKEEAAFHACAAETSCVLAIRPQAVNMGRAERGWTGDLFLVLDRLFADGMKSITENGILGDATKGRRDVGEALLEYFSGVIADDLRPRLGRN